MKNTAKTLCYYYYYYYYYEHKLAVFSKIYLLTLVVSIYHPGGWLTDLYFS